MDVAKREESNKTHLFISMKWTGRSDLRHEEVKLPSYIMETSNPYDHGHKLFLFSSPFVLSLAALFTLLIARQKENTPKCSGCLMVSDSFWPFCWSELFMLWRLRSLTGCAVGIWPTRSPQRRTAVDLPVLSADSVSQGPPIQKAIRVNLCKHTRRRSCKKCLDSSWAAKHEQLNNYWKWK